MNINAANAKWEWRWIYAGLAVAIVCDTVAQLLWKHAASHLPETASLTVLVASFFREPLLLVLIGVFALQLMNWLILLERADLSYVQPITSLSFGSVVVCSVWLLGERLDARRALGILLVLVGVTIIATDAARSGRRA